MIADRDVLPVLSEARRALAEGRVGVLHVSDRGVFALVDTDPLVFRDGLSADEVAALREANAAAERRQYGIARYEVVTWREGHGWACNRCGSGSARCPAVVAVWLIVAGRMPGQTLFGPPPTVAAQRRRWRPWRRRT